MINPSRLSSELTASAVKNGFSVRLLLDLPTAPILAFTRQPKHLSQKTPHIYLSSGVHGDEPAGPLALQRILEADLLPANLAITLIPLINPSGIANQTRVNDLGQDLNRDFFKPSNPESKAVKSDIDHLPKIDLSIALHEDWESSGFYMYALSPSPKEKAFRRILDTVAAAGPIEQATEIDDSPADRGLIYRPVDDAISERMDWPEAFALYSKNKHTHLTIESPSSLAIETRIAMHMSAILAAIRIILPNRPKLPLE